MLTLLVIDAALDVERDVGRPVGGGRVNVLFVIGVRRRQTARGNSVGESESCTSAARRDAAGSGAGGWGISCRIRAIRF